MHTDVTLNPWICVLVPLALLILGLVLGRYAGRADLLAKYERPGGLMDKAYDEGRNDERAEAQDHHDPLPAVDTLAADSRAAIPEDPRRPDTDASYPEQMTDDQWADELHEMNEHIFTEEARYWAIGRGGENLPGRVPSESHPAGEHHARHYGEPPLPSVLHLGQEFSGDDQTFARWQVRRWQFRRDMGLGAAA